MASKKRRISARSAAVLGALANAPEQWRYLSDLCEETHIKAGAMFPLLMRLADRRLLEAHWEKEAPQGRPPRRMFRISGAGRALAAEIGAKGADAGYSEPDEFAWEGEEA